MLNSLFKPIIFILLLIITHLFMFKDGLWLYQDGAYWYKTEQEILSLLYSQFSYISNFRFYLGYDQGLASFTRIFDYTYSYILFKTFGGEISQIVFSLTTYIMSFTSFYFFSGIFFKDTKTRYILSLIYTFNPLLYSLRGTGTMYPVVPLFIYSFYKYFFESKLIISNFLLLNLLSLLLWVSNIRLLQANLFVIIPLITYLCIKYREKIIFKKIFIYLSVIAAFLSPYLYSLFLHFADTEPGIFNYGNVSKSMTKDSIINAFNLFKTNNISLFDSNIYIVSGILVFCLFLFSIIRSFSKIKSNIYFINLLIFLFGMTFYGLGNLFGRDSYALLIKYLPFMTNAPFYAAYIYNVPMIIILGLTAKYYSKLLILYSVIFILFGALPFLNLNDFKFQKMSLSEIPTSYYNYFIDPFYGFSEATFYYPDNCWRGKYLNLLSKPTPCMYFGFRYPSIINANPRFISGSNFDINERLMFSTKTDNLRVTHNLKNIILANDIVKEIEFGPLFGEKEIKKVKFAKNVFKKNKSLIINNNYNFTHYFYRDKGKYDFYIYSPKIVNFSDFDKLASSTLEINARPVVLDKKHIKLTPSISQQDVRIEYKSSSIETGIKFLKIMPSNIDENFMVQFNQSFNSNWKFRFIDKSLYDGIKCINQVENFSITNNSRCLYEGNILQVSNIKYLFYPQIESNNHLKGNFVNNTWIVDKSFKSESGVNRELYAVLILDKQVGFTLSIFLSIFTFCLILLFLTLSVFKRFIQKYI